MYDKDLLITDAVSAGVCSKPSEIRVIFPVDLPPDGSHGEYVAATDGYLTVVVDGRAVRQVTLSEVSEFTLTAGVGCLFIGCTAKDGGQQIICRGSNAESRMFIAAIGDLNGLLRGIHSDTVHEYGTGRSCPRCNRPLPPGSTECPHCSRSASGVRRLLRIASPWRWMILLSVALYFVSSAVSLVSPYLNRILVDDYIKAASPVLAGFVGVIASMLAVSVLGQIIGTLRDVIVIDASAGLIKRLRQMTFDKVQALSISKIQKRTSGELINRVSSDTEVISNFLTNDLGSILQMGSVLIAVSVILFVYDYRIALLVLCPVPVIAYLNRHIRVIFHRYIRRSWNMTSRANSVLHDAFSGIRVVKAFGMEEREIERHRRVTDRERQALAESEIAGGIIMPCLSFMLGIGEFFLLYYVGQGILDGRMTVGEMVQFSSYTALIYGPMRWISEIPRIVSRTSTSTAKIFEILDEDPGVPDSPGALPIDIRGEIELSDVSFSYDSVSPVLRNVSAVIHPGEMVGIVGRSGVGKSTLINLVMRMYDPTSGKITVDGRDLRDIPQESLRSQMGVVLQETYLFSGSIFDNIRYAKPNADAEEIIAAAKLAGAHKFIIKLPDGYDTRVGERGYSLSGGERQRVSIARALLRNPQILILDEATSALDTETEKEVQDVLQKLTDNRTTLAIAHRLSTLRNADRILVLDRGGVAEFGSHEELMRRHGIYYDLVMAQRQMSKMKKTV